MAGETVLKKAYFNIQWVPEAVFAGYYIAYKKGIYKKYGIDLTIVHGELDAPSLDSKSDSVTTTMWTMWLSDAIQNRAEGEKLVNIAQIMQQSSLMLIAKKSSGINKIQDLNGKKVGLWRTVAFPILPRIFLQKSHVTVKLIPVTTTINLFLRDGVDAIFVMWYDQYHDVINSGINPDELETFFLYKHGLDIPEAGIYTLEDTFQKDPVLCCKFVKASIEGWRYAFAHPEETVNTVLKYMERAHVPASRVHQRWMLEKIKDLISTPDDPVNMGQLLPEDYDRAARILKENGSIEKIPTYKSFYKKCAADVEK